MEKHSDNTNGAILNSARVTQIETYAITALAAVAWYNSIELVVLCLSSFKPYRGCYFWSLLVASASIIPHTLGVLFFVFDLGVSSYVSVTLIVLSWYPMVTGHSLVLWSRLHFVLRSPRVLHALLIVIIADAILLHTPTTVLIYGSLTSHGHRFLVGYSVMERIQLIGFTLQEILISGIYIWETSQLLRLRPHGPSNAILTHLLLINVVLVALDVALVGLQYAGMYAVQLMFKPVAYSIKLKLEYSILGQLIYIATEAASSSYTGNLRCTFSFRMGSFRYASSGPSREGGIGFMESQEVASWPSLGYGRERAASC